MSSFERAWPSAISGKRIARRTAASPSCALVKERTGLYRYPEPKILSGSNFADVGFEFDASTGRVVALCAIDNLMKGAAGTALQCANLMMRMGGDRWDSGFRGCIPYEANPGTQAAQDPRPRTQRQTS